MIWYEDNPEKKQSKPYEWTTPAYHLKNDPPEKRSRGKLLLERWRSIRSFHLLWLLVAPISLLFLLFTVVLILEGFWPTALWFFLPSIIVWLPLAFLSYATRYRIYENRIDILTGIFNYREESIWLFQIRDAAFTRSQLDLITNTATVLVTFEADGHESTVRKLPLIGLGTIRFMQEFRDELFDVAIHQRRLLKGWHM